MSPVASVGVDSFNFLFGRWRVHHRFLAKRLAGSTEWREFDGTVDARPMLDGAANVDDNVLDLPAGPMRAMSIRSFDRVSGTWSIWWLAGGNPTVLETPMVGSFVDGVGTFLADDLFEGGPIRARFLWTRIESASPRWEQAYSVDGGSTWETNWIMDFTRAP